MRLFFGLELEPDTARRIADWRDRQFQGSGRPVPAANFHITLAFVGELPPPRLEGLCLSVDELLQGRPEQGGRLRLDHTGYWHKQGIYWLGPSRWPRQLDRLARRLQGLAASVGARRDRRPFQPHVTLFRRCDDAPPAPAMLPAIEIHYADFTLFESRQGKQGVSYHPLQYWPLSL